MTRFEQENITAPVVIQTVGGNLRLRGRVGGRLVVDGDEVLVEQIGVGQPYIVRGSGDVRMTVPDHVDVSVQQVGGNATLTDLGGKTEIQTVGGDLVMRNARTLQAQTVGGDLRVKQIEGDVQVHTVGADASLREVGGAAQVTNIGADLYLRHIRGSCVAEQVGSDLVLNLEFVPELDYHFQAGGDVLCRITPDANVHFVLPLGTDIKLDIVAEITENEADEQQVVTLGDGSATVMIDDATMLRIVGEEEDHTINLGIQIEEELEARLSSLEEKLSQQLEGLDERILAKTQKVTARVQRQAARAQKRMFRDQDRPKRKRRNKRWGGKGRRGRFAFDAASGGPPAPPADPVSEQERLLILQMVRDGKITIEEAERLLAALDS